MTGAGDNVIVFNGEVYNYLELKRELEGDGYAFRTGTDTEVIIAAYDRWGEACLERFNGMFAFAIWDPKQERLFAARDRVGIKPLYYCRHGERLIIASEVKAILAVLPEKPSVDPSLIDAYMNFGYIPGDRTLQKGIYRLLPGHCLTFDMKDITIRRYWDVAFTEGAALGSDADIDDYLERFEALFNSAIDFRLRSDVPLGIFLSGGIDSSAVVAMLAPRVTMRLRTFSVAYDFGQNFNETNFARMVAGRYNTDHNELFLTPEAFRDFIPGYVRHMDEPVTEAAAISLYYLSKKAKEKVTVILSGEGSDELFAGYDFYMYNQILERLRLLLGPEILGFAHQKAKPLLKRGKLLKYLELGAQPMEERYRGISTYEASMRNGLYAKGFADNVATTESTVSAFLAEIFDRTKGWNPLSRMLYFDTKTWLVDDLLIKADRMSMAASLELRVPFLDHRMVEFAAAMPSSFKIRKRRTKYLLKKMMADRLPEPIIRRKKMGFPTPLSIMFRGALFEYVADTLLSGEARSRGYFNPERIEAILSEHRSGKADHHRILWQLLVLEEWHRQFA